MGNFCSFYIKTPEEEIIKDPKILAQIRNKELEEYQKSKKPRTHNKLYRIKAESELMKSENKDS